MRFGHIAIAVLVMLASLTVGCQSAPATPTTVQPTPSPVPPTPFFFEDEASMPSPTPTSEALSALTEEPATAPATPVPMTQHTVEPGDTLLALALRYSVPMAAIQLANDFGASTVVQAGQALNIPATEEWADASPFWVLYEVMPGDTLLGLKETYDVEVETLRAVNGMTDSTIRVGQTLILPLEAPAIAQAPEPPATPVPTTAPPTSTPVTSQTDTSEQPTAAPTIAPTVPSADPPADVAAWPREVVRLMNEVRAAHGLAPMAYNETLAVAAQQHANDCMQRGWCSHTGSDGAYIKERLERVGYTGAGWAECWAQRLTPQGAIDIWMDEVPPNDPHRRTLLSTWLTEVGVGVAETDWGYYFIADFGRP